MGKSLIRRIFGDWGEFKKGTMAGNAIRQQATSRVTGRSERWLEEKGKTKSAEWVAERRKKFKRNYVTVACIWVVAWVLLSYFVGIVWPIGTGTVSVTIMLIAWQMYRMVVRRIEKGQGGE